MTVKIHSGCGTHTGCVREQNEDSYAVRHELGLWVVADGMGGHAGGAIASAITVEEIIMATEQGLSLTKSLRRAHAAVLKAGVSGRGKPGMGATVVVLKVINNAYQIAWVGDSRAYFWNGTELQQLTRDHSYVQLLVDNHKIAKEDARNHPMGHVVNQAIGSTAVPDISVDTAEGHLNTGDRILLCSDGLTDEVADEEIKTILKREGDEQLAVDQLIKLALDHGGSDNVTTLLIGV